MSLNAIASAGTWMPTLIIVIIATIIIGWLVFIKSEQWSKKEKEKEPNNLTKQAAETNIKAWEVGITFVVIAVIVFIGLLILGKFYSGEMFESNCINGGGQIFITPNVTCAAKYSKCYINCIINNKSINFYDKNQCEYLNCVINQSLQSL